VEILKSLDHPNIVRALETFDYRGRLYIVMELCGGRDLYARDPYTEQEARTIVVRLFQAMSYLHGKGIVHRDLKYENVMFDDTTPNSGVKLIDFGLSQKFASGEHLHATVGTVYVQRCIFFHCRSLYMYRVAYVFTLMVLYPILLQN
jgi:calcium-dependent protein kinase